MAEWRKSSYSGPTNGGCVEVSWRKSSHSGPTNGSCVEVAMNIAGVAVRDSKNTDGPTLAFGLVTWRKFLGERGAAELGA